MRSVIRSVVGRIPGVRRAYRGLLAARERRRVAAYERRFGLAPTVGPDDRPTPEVMRLLADLERRRRVSREPVIDATSPVDVVMTTYGDRIDTVHLAIESIGSGDLRPRRLVLYLDDADLAARRPKSVRDLELRGLEVVVVPPGLGVHTKYWYYVEAESEPFGPVVTSDDDILYPPDWLARLAEAAARTPGVIVCARAHTIVLDEDGIAPYRTWVPCLSTAPGFRHFATSVSGQLLPTEFLRLVRAEGRAFMDHAPTNDDIWLHHLAVANGWRVMQVGDHPEHYPFVPGTQSAGLWVQNVVEERNDAQVRATYSTEDLRRLRSEESAVSGELP